MSQEPSKNATQAKTEESKQLITAEEDELDKHKQMEEII